MSSTAEQNPAHQVDALTCAGVVPTDIHLKGLQEHPVLGEVEFSQRMQLVPLESR